LTFHVGNCALKRKVHLANGCIAAEKQLRAKVISSFLLFNDIGAFSRFYWSAICNFMYAVYRNYCVFHNKYYFVFLFKLLSRYF